MTERKPQTVNYNQVLTTFDLAQDRLYTGFKRFWCFLNPGNVAGFVVASIFIVGSGLAVNGNWLLIYIGLQKQFLSPDEDHDPTVVENRFNGLAFYVIGSVAAAYAVYFPISCFVHWYFYIRQRNKPELWKCQPKSFLSWKDEKHAIVSGVSVLTLVSCVSGILSCYIGNGGFSTLYYQISDMGVTYYLLSIPCLSLLTELCLYYAHRMMHFPILYRNIHKWHHRYKQPTPFASTAMNPLEMLTYQFCIFSPIFIFPLHWSVFIGNVLYLYYYNVLGHSGVKLESIWPWQPSTTFHDNHHQFFHVNFGFNLDIWDKLHGTYRVKTRIYSEDIFYGYGKSATDSSEKEINEHLSNFD